MKFHLNHLGQDLGIHEAEELLRRRTAGELPGEALVWRPGMAQWERLDTVLPPPLPLSASTPAPPQLPSEPATPTRPTPTPTPDRTASPAFWITVVLAVLAGFIGLVTVVAGAFASQMRLHPSASAQVRTETGKEDPSSDDSGDAVEISDAARIAGQPLRIPATSRTPEQRLRWTEEFLGRMYLEAYRQHADRQAAGFAEDEAFLAAWVKDNALGFVSKPDGSLEEQRRKRSSDTGSRDPVVLLVSSLMAEDRAEILRLLERAESAFQGSTYGPYPRFRLAVKKFQLLPKDDPKTDAVADEAVKAFAALFGPEGLREADQENLADSLMDSWGVSFRKLRATALIEAARKADGKFAWLAGVLEGEHEIDLAWKARGGGFADTVTRQGQRDFEDHLEKAEAALSEAWNLHPEWPRPAARMIAVSMGLHGAEEMHRWFGRAIEAEMNHQVAWNAFLFGLRPRWHGDRQALLALGRAAVDSGRFDTGVPKRLFDAIEAVEADLVRPPGRRIFGDRDVWPLIDSMYRGYTSNATDKLAGWRTVYAVVAHIAGHPDVARGQLEALGWKPEPTALRAWDMEEESFLKAVRIRTGPAGADILAAETTRGLDLPEVALGLLKEAEMASDPNPDVRPHIDDLRRLLEVEKRLNAKEWVPFQPTATNDPLWRLDGGTVEKAEKDAFEIRLKNASHTAYSRFRVGSDFEIRGEFEVLSTSNGDFQAGFVFGHPDPSGRCWQSMRIKQSREEGAVATIAQAWSRTQVLRPAPLVAQGPNRFRFVLKDRLATLEVNGKRIFDEAAFPDGPGISTDDYEVGIGAYNRDFETVVRYRNLEIRRL